MASLIMVTGGTGTLGRHLVPLLNDTGHQLRVLSRRPPPHEPHTSVEYVTGDLRKDVGIQAAVNGVHTVVHLAGGPRGDTEATRNLMRAASRAGVRHVVFISVIGADRVPLGYFRAKLGAEQEVIDSGVPWTILRAAQFHDLALTAVRAMTRLPIVPAPRAVRLQPVDPRDVAARLAELTVGGPAGRVRDLVGPTVYTLGELARSYVDARGTRRLFVPVGLPGRVGHAYWSGANLTLADADHGQRSWEAFLENASSPTRT